MIKHHPMYSYIIVYQTEQGWCKLLVIIYISKHIQCYTLIHFRSMTFLDRPTWLISYLILLCVNLCLWSGDRGLKVEISWIQPGDLHRNLHMDVFTVPPSTFNIPSWSPFITHHTNPIQEAPNFVQIGYFLRLFAQNISNLCILSLEASSYS